jgi:hypothetical protein
MPLTPNTKNYKETDFSQQTLSLNRFILCYYALDFQVKFQGIFQNILDLPGYGETPDGASARCFKGCGTGIQCGAGGANVVYQQYLLSLKPLTAGEGIFYVLTPFQCAPGPCLRNSVPHSN